MKDIHHTCRCTGQQFTFKEWCAWLDNHKKAGQVDRITASADRYKLKEQKKEYLTRAGAQLKHTQIAELEFLLQ